MGGWPEGGGVRVAVGWLWLALALGACGAEPAPPPAAPAPAGQQLRLAPSEIAELQPVSAAIASRDQVEVLARIPGILTGISVRAGDVVKQGQQIGMVVDSRLGPETQASAAQVAAAAAVAARANADLARIRDLYGHSVYARARLDQAVAEASAADAQLAAARAREAAGHSAQGQGALVAPASGRVLRADIPAGAPVLPGMSVATLTAGPVLLRLMLPESAAGRVRPGARVVVDDPAFGGVRQGRVVQVYPAISGGEVRADATLAGLPARFVGRRVQAAVEIGRRRALVVPRRFVVTRFGMDQVQLLVDGKRRAMVPVQTAPTDDPAQLEILSGVAAGDILMAAAPAARR